MAEPLELVPDQAAALNGSEAFQAAVKAMIEYRETKLGEFFTQMLLRGMAPSQGWKIAIVGDVFRLEGAQLVWPAKLFAWRAGLPVPPGTRVILELDGD